MNQILGAEHFVVYNYSISPAVDQILQRYQQDGLVTVLPWPLPTLDVHYYGQMAALNDCIYRNRNISRFVVVVDTDELIIPRESLTWMELIDTVSPQERDVSALRHPSGSSKNWLKATGSFEFRSGSFVVVGTPSWTALPSELEFSEEEKNNLLKYKIHTLTQLQRARKVLPRKHRTKYIARPELVNISGIHFVHSFMSNVSSLDVRENFALVHHYQKLDFADTVMDTNILKFKDQLFPRLLQQYRRFSNLIW
ncbi:unnamed protein product [Candidula unifasciata]|uniref:Glycosyltransferase family 92 protein n=1 Tax=Candidula unifasciata TaxID=100452 RepID=A0A8S3ZW72_9EUPU|nr:unnamed protein product [Candidula unifasciata]